MEQQIKKMIEKRLKNSNYSLDLKNKTLKYLKLKTNQTTSSPKYLIAISIIVVCIILLIGMYHYLKSNTLSNQQQMLTSITTPLPQPQLMSHLTEQLSELELQYQEIVTRVYNDSMMVSYAIEGMLVYEIEFNQPLVQYNLCEEIDKYLIFYDILERPFNLMKLNEYQVFVYYQIPEILLEYLNSKNTSLLCL